jgi:hypothetical protein
VFFEDQASKTFVDLLPDQAPKTLPGHSSLADEEF